MSGVISPLYPVQPAGIQAAKLEDMERRLRGDLTQEAASWGGRVMLHAELPGPPPSDAAATGPSIAQPSMYSEGSGRGTQPVRGHARSWHAMNLLDQLHRPGLAMRLTLSASCSSFMPGAGCTACDGPPAATEAGHSDRDAGHSLIVIASISPEHYS